MCRAVNREALLVLGMHRGGTSAAAGLLVRLGAQGPKTLMPANPDNPAGYWESAVFCELHERLLRAAGSRWDAFTRLEPDRLQSAMRDGLTDECRGAIRTEFGDARRFVVKDPRMCRLVPFWRQMLKMEHIAAAAILVLRSPADVARSLAARNGFEPDLSLLIWLRHVLDAEHDTRAVRRTFVRYQELLENWTSVAERISQDLQSPWPTRSVVDDAEIDRFVSHRLCHHHGDPDIAGVAPALSDWTRRAWTALGWLHDRDPSRTAQAFGTLDAIRAEFDRNTLVLGDVRDRIHQSLRTQIDRVERELDRVEREQRTLREHTAGLEAVRDGLQHRIEALEREAGVLRQELSAAQAHADALRKSASWRVTAPLRAVYRIFR
jgi:hypothetical protein